jgi:HAD superfamily phosphoserine phosphatase-like hydrolase
MSTKQLLLASDFDQTLSFNDSGLVLSEILGIEGFAEKAAGLAQIHLVQQGAELAYLLLHDPEYRRVRREHLIEVGRRVRLKQNLELLLPLLGAIEGYEFSFYVISAAPEEVIRSALQGLVAEDHIFGTRFHWSATTGEIESIIQVPAGYGKVAVLEELRQNMQVGSDRVIYVGDGSSDVHVMLHINRTGGLTVAVSENRYLTPIAERTILSEDSLSILIPILEDIAGWDSSRIRGLFAAHGLVLQDWDKTRTDSLTIRDLPVFESVPSAPR